MGQGTGLRLLCAWGLGAVLDVNRMNAVGEKLSLPDLFVPIVLASALVVRVIKTRSEINEWNKR